MSTREKVERLLSEGLTQQAIAQQLGISQQRVSQLKNLVQGPCTRPVSLPNPVRFDSAMKSLTLRLTIPVFDALTEACAITNRKDPDDPITVEDYVEECLTTRLVELGLIRKYKKVNK